MTKRWTIEEVIEHRKAWAQDLRSGEYTQTKGALCRTKTLEATLPAGHCCLGVAQDRAQKACPEMGWKWTEALEPNDEGIMWAGNEKYPREHSGHCAPWVEDYFGLSSSEADELVRFNDQTFMGFEGIAKKIDYGTTLISGRRGLPTPKMVYEDG